MLRTTLGGDHCCQKLISNFFPLPPNARVLDIGCGPGSMLEFLPDDVYYVGVDHNPKYIAHAKKRFGTSAEFHCLDAQDDLFSILKGSFDGILAIALIHHLDDRQTKAMLNSASNLLKPGGVLLTLDPVFVENQNLISHWLISNDRGQYVRNPADYKSLLDLFFTNVETTIANNLIRVPYHHCINLAKEPQ